MNYELKPEYSQSESGAVDDLKIYYNVTIKLPEYVRIFEKLPHLSNGEIDWNLERVTTYHVYARDSEKYFDGLPLCDRRARNHGKTYDGTIYSDHDTNPDMLRQRTLLAIQKIHAGLIKIENILIANYAKMKQAANIISELAETSIPATPANIASIASRAALEERANTLKIVRQQLRQLRYGKSAIKSIDNI